MRDFLHFADIILCFWVAVVAAFLSLYATNIAGIPSNKSCAIEYDGDDDGHDDSVHIFFLFSVLCIYSQSGYM